MVVVFFPFVRAKAINPIDVSKKASLTIQYKSSGAFLSDLPVEIFRFAEIKENGTFDLVSPFDKYQINIYGITSEKEWKEVSSTLSSYIVADKIEPYKALKTNSEGKAVFSDIETGMYLVKEVLAENEGKTIHFESFVSILPRTENEEHLYESEAFPKSETITPSQEKFRIIKQWKDIGFEEKRPDKVLVDIYKNGVFHSTEALSSENSWVYEWESEKGIIWTAVERNISSEYTVTITKNGNTIIITNVYNGKETPPGKPGDEGAFWKYSIFAFLSGTLLLFFASRLRNGAKQ